MTNPEIYRLKLQQGMYTRIARAMGVGRSHVSRVANGERHSLRIEKAIRSETQRIKRLVEKYQRDLERSTDKVAA